MTTIRRITTSQIEGDNANNTDTNEIRPFGETAFYLDTNSNPNKLVLMMFDGTRTHQKSKVLSPGILYGSNADSGDGAGYDTIKLIPDAGLGSDQYIVIDPTAPNHIHIRPGGPQDNSTADLYLGAEQTFVRISDSLDNVVIGTSIVGEGILSYNWTFDNAGKVTFPSGGAIESVGMGWIGLTNGNSNTPVSVVYKNSDIALSEILVSGGNTDGSVSVFTQDTAVSRSNQWTFDSNGVLATPGDIVVDTAKISSKPTATSTGTIISIPLNAAGDTNDYTGGASVIEVSTNPDTDLVQAGWIITFNSGVQRTVSSTGVAGGYTSIYFSEANPGGALYPLTIQSADYAPSSIAKIELIPNSSNTSVKFTFDVNGNLTFPDNTVQTTAAPPFGQYNYPIDGTNTLLNVAAVVMNLIYIHPAIGYSGSDTHTIVLPPGNPGQRLVVVNGSSLCTIVVDNDYGMFMPYQINPNATAEFIFVGTTYGDGWTAMYGIV